VSKPMSSARIQPFASVACVMSHQVCTFSIGNNSKSIQKGAPEEEDQLETVLELHGNCFNATLVVGKHTKRCPWCPMEIGKEQGEGNQVGIFSLIISSGMDPKSRN